MTLSTLPVDVLIQVALVLPCREFGRLLQTNRYMHDTLDTWWVWCQRSADRLGRGFLLEKLKQANLHSPADMISTVDSTTGTHTTSPLSPNARQDNAEEPEGLHDSNLSRTSVASKEQLIEWYRLYSK